jgi:hypothetical protein
VSRAGRAGLAANAALALAVVLLPWCELDGYAPNGWDATDWARAALVLAVAHLAALRLGLRVPPASAAAALAAVGFRVVFPPDFGLDLDGLDVPVERRAGSWLALAAAAAALAAAALDRPPAPRRGRAGGW